ncbi:hypothetical protein PPERSA_09687 [Pseudocohnilembus persalinus]|uniref:Uncharacterized protein n=1 Tax=Pseudocohnilembus persalinus TaxID=266149 RepID=A0A0V0R733_PSEPJ|nr:hypothetical protein PPERSA_09687 [Pseudocohnilembus persalinus]|eukprot:KRX10303.1 hypothetical protein PPERSA_09687 [Pseudocohnilembus persalinus]
MFIFDEIKAVHFSFSQLSIVIVQGFSGQVNQLGRYIQIWFNDFSFFVLNSLFVDISPFFNFFNDILNCSFFYSFFPWFQAFLNFFKFVVIIQDEHFFRFFRVFQRILVIRVFLGRALSGVDEGN